MTRKRLLAFWSMNLLAPPKLSILVKSSGHTITVHVACLIEVRINRLFGELNVFVVGSLEWVGLGEINAEAEKGSKENKEHQHQRGETERLQETYVHQNRKRGNLRGLPLTAANTPTGIIAKVRAVQIQEK